MPGILVLANNDVVNSKVLPLMKQLSFGGINFGDMIIALCVSLIVIGTLVILVSLLGLMGACTGNPGYLDIVSTHTEDLIYLCKKIVKRQNVKKGVVQSFTLLFSSSMAVLSSSYF